MRLNAQTPLPENVARPGFDRDSLRPGIVHFGLGAFHRAHQAVYTQRALQADLDAWGIVAVNLRGAFLGMKYVLEQMMVQGSGAIVNTASHAAIRAEPTLGMYAATKHALAGLTVTAASEYGPHGLRINAVCPGGVKTAMTAGIPESADLTGFGPMQRMAEPGEIAATVAFLLSDEASYINGVLLPVDGGLAV